MLRTSGSVAAGFAWLLLHELGSGRELPYPQISLLRPCGHLLTLWITCIIAFSCCAVCSCLWEETVSNPKCVARTTREKTFKCSQRCLGGKDCASLHMQLSDQGHSETQRPCSVCRFLADSTGVMCLLHIWQLLLLSCQMILFLMRCVHVYPPPALISCSNKASLILTIEKLEKILSGNKQKFLIIPPFKGNNF